MKKITIILLSMLLVLSIGQAGFANPEVGIKLGYDRKQSIAENPNIFKSEEYINSFSFGIYGKYDFTDAFSIAAHTDILWGNGKYSDTFGLNEEDKTITLKANVSGQYDVLALEIANIGLQAGIIDEYTKYIDRNSYNFFFIHLGAYINMQATSKINFYGDFKFPVFSILSTSSPWTESLLKPYTGFFKTFLYDISLGLTYDIAPNILIGFEGNTSNANYWGFTGQYLKDDDNLKSVHNFHFSIGAKIGYKF